jgi:hypothetical protein
MFIDGSALCATGGKRKDKTKQPTKIKPPLHFGIKSKPLLFSAIQKEWTRPPVSFQNK